MNLRTSLTLFIILFISILTCSSPKAEVDRNNNLYYSKEDFRKIKKFDTHIHINTEQTAFIQLAKENNFQFLDIIDDRPFGLPMAGQESIAFKHLKSYPEQMKVATTFSVHDFDNPNWTEKTINALKESIQKGARAVKIWKNIGMDLRDKNGKFVMVDDPRLGKIFEFLEKNKIPLIGHNGEPRDCWKPLDEMTFSKDYYGAHPEYHMFLHPEYPSYEQQITARDNLLGKYSELKFVGAHLGSLEWSLDELAIRFERYSNLCVDLSRISNLKLHALNNWEKTRNFFIKYQDRLIYGSDKAINTVENEDKLIQDIRKSWIDDWIFFVSADKITLSGFGDLYGLNLPKDIVDKIYYKNAESWLLASTNNSINN